MSDWVLSSSLPQTKGIEANSPINSDWALTEPKEESFFDKLPRNIIAGAENLGHKALSYPHNFAKNTEDLARIYNAFSHNANAMENYILNAHLADKIPLPQEHNFAQEMGQKGEGTFADRAIQKGIEYSPEILTGVNALRNVIPHLTKRGATKKLKQAQQTFKDWAENNTDKLNGKLNVNPELIEDARQYLPNNLDERHLLNSATNDYDKLFNLQSEVGKVSAGRMGKLRSIFAPETHMKGKAGLAARRNLINAMHENLQSEGLLDTSNLFREGQNDFRRYMQFKPYRNAIALAGLGAAGNELFPKNPLTDLVKKLMFKAGGH